MAGSPQSPPVVIQKMDTAWLWFTAIVFSLALNLGLFGLMPDLVRRDIGKAVPVESLQPVTIVRMTPPEPPPPKKEKPLPPQSEKARPEIVVAKPVSHLPNLRPQQLVFDFRPELPKISTKLPVLPMQSVAYEAAAIPPVEVVAAPAADSYGIGEIDSPLIAISQVPPVYPLRARQKGIEGSVQVKFLVTEKGAVENVRILAAEPKNLFDKNVLKAVSGWRFKPGTVDGKAVKTWVLKTVEFKLQ